jgi:hypothetical protein
MRLKDFWLQSCMTALSHQELGSKTLVTEEVAVRCTEWFRAGISKRKHMMTNMQLRMVTARAWPCRFRVLIKQI